MLSWLICPRPKAFRARTWKVYRVPFLRPMTLARLLSPATVTVCPPGLATMEYAVIGEPLLGAGDHATVADPSPAVAVAGAGILPGTSAAVNRTGVEVAPMPMPFTA